MGICCSRDDVEQMKTNVTQGQKVALLDPKPKKKSEKQRQSEKERMTELRAAILIQKWFRMWWNAIEARRQLAWCIFQKVEYLGERNQMKLYNFFRLLIDEFSKESEQGDKKQLKPGKLNDQTEKLMVIPSEVDVNISLPFSAKKLNVLMNFLKTGKNLHYTCVINLLIMTIEKLRTKSNFNEVSTSVTHKITIIGDLHGSLDDLLTIFYKNDIPSVNNPYVFNGDMVDKGGMSIEVAVILCYCFLLFPNHVHLNRGNHEDPELNENHGFVKELKMKYRHTNKKIYTLLRNFYKHIPLGTIIDKKIFVVHGGISDTTDLKILGGIVRSKYDSIMKPVRDVVQTKKDDWEQFIDIVWSDPVPENGCTKNVFRGGGKCFGPDVTKNFLQKNKFELLIRSHECKPDGYEYGHSGKVLTVFSSSNYYHQGSNKGAYIVYTGDVKKIRHVQFVCSDESVKNITFKENVVAMEEKAIAELKRTIFTHRFQLLKQFKDTDIQKTGTITMDAYGNVLGEVLGMNLPWRLVQPKISQKDKDNLIIYETTFEQTQQIQAEGASDILFNNLGVLETIFRAIDKDNSGLITMDEFNNAMSVLTKHSDINIGIEMEGLGELIDADNDGNIDIDEFFDAFKICSI